MAFKWSSLALLFVVAALASSAVYAGSVSVYVQSSENGLSIAYPNITCELGGTVHTPGPGNNYPLEVNFTLPDGTYECTIDIAGFYKYQRPLVVGSSAISSELFYVVPVRPGITILPEAMKRNGLGAYMNMTFPNGVFSFNYASAMMGATGAPSMSEGYYYGAGTPSASFFFSYTTFQLSAAQSGVYRVGFSAQWGNFSAATHRFFIFAGLDQQNGFFKSMVSDATPSTTDAKFWYAGDITVSNPAFGCSEYNWTDVNEYSTASGFNNVNHGVGDVVLSECYDTSPAALQCTSLLYSDTVQTATCGAFGDPHILMFNGTGVTCGTDSIITLADNDYVKITAQTVPSPGATNNATDITSITLRYKSVCNPIIVTFAFNASSGSITPFSNSLNAGNHRARVVGNNIYIDAIRLRLQVRQVGVFNGATWSYNVVFGLSMPLSLADQTTGLCSEGCPATAISLGNRKKALPARAVAAAADACTDAGVSSDSFTYDACVFDVATTGINGYADVAKSNEDAQNEVRTSWDSDPVAETPDAPSSPSDAPSATPSSTSNPTDSNPTATPTVAPRTAPTASNVPTDSSSAMGVSALLVAISVLGVLSAML